MGKSIDDMIDALALKEATVKDLRAAKERTENDYAVAVTRLREARLEFVYWLNESGVLGSDFIVVTTYHRQDVKRPAPLPEPSETLDLEDGFGRSPSLKEETVGEIDPLVQRWQDQVKEAGGGVPAGIAGL